MHRHRRVVGIICPSHGYIQGSYGPECTSPSPKRKLYINTSEWVKGWYEHIDSYPIYIESKRQLKEECDKRGMVAKSLLHVKSSSGHELENKI